MAAGRAARWELSAAGSGGGRLSVLQPGGSGWVSREEVVGEVWFRETRDSGVVWRFVGGMPRRESRQSWQSNLGFGVAVVVVVGEEALARGHVR